MGLKKLKPNTPGQRHKVADTFEDVTKGSPEKSLIAKKKSSGGRNASGKMTVRNIGGGHKKKYRLIDFKRTKLNVPATVKSIEYDPNRTARIALLYYSDGEKKYILAPNGLEVGATVQAGKGSPIEVGNSLPLTEIPLGTVVHNVEFQPGQGGKLARSAGSYVQLTAKEGKFATLKLPSGETRQVLVGCSATIGAVSNSDHQLVVSGKAGRSRWLGRRPRVRGTAMNPIDHPHGGGEGRAKGRHPVTPWGKPTKGYKTRAKTKPSNKFIVKGRK